MSRWLDLLIDQFWHAKYKRFFALLLLISSSLFLFSCVGSNSEVEGLTAPQCVNPIVDRPSVVAWVDGQAVTLALDTGSTYPTLLFEDAVKALGGRVRGNGSVKTTKLKAILYGNHAPEEEQYVVDAPGAMVQGLVGWPVIKEYVWHLNLNQREQSFGDAIPFSFTRKAQFVVKEKDGVPYLMVPSTGQRVALDTGAPHGVYMDDWHWRRWKEDHPEVFVTYYTGYSPAAGGFYTKECARVKEFPIGDITLYNVLVCQSFIDPKVAQLKKTIPMMFGLEALMSHEIWLDGPRSRMYMMPLSRSERERELPALNLVGIAIRPKTQNPSEYDILVMPGSVAWNAGVRDGDKLISLNGQKHPQSDLIEYLTSQEDAEARIVISRKGKIKSYHWVVPSEDEVQPVIEQLPEPPPIENEEEVPPVTPKA